MRIKWNGPGVFHDGSMGTTLQPGDVHECSDAVAAAYMARDAKGWTVEGDKKKALGS